MAEWGAGVAGGFLVLASFMLDYDSALRGLPPAALARTLYRRH